MIRLGVCTSIDNAARMAQIGFDYIEPPLRAIADLSDAEFDAQRAILNASGLRCEAMNCMLPGEIRVVGDRVDESRIREYLDRAFRRASLLGTQVIIFGSGGSRGVEPGGDFACAWRQLTDYLRIAAEYADQYGVNVAVEPLCRAECNIINFVSEAMALTSMVNHPRIGVLGDSYHMVLGCEPESALENAGAHLFHVHMACAEGRRYPKPNDGGNHEALFAALNRMGYAGRVSIEAGTDDIFSDAETAFPLLNSLRKEN